MKLVYQIDGRPEYPALVLLNGLFADLNSWDPAMAYLDRFHVLRYDGRGQGRSPKPEGPYRLDLLLEDLASLLEVLDWPPTFLAGISNGGSLALAFARRFPERVRGVVAADCHHRVTPLLRLKVNSWLQAHRLGGPAHRFDVATPWIWSETMLAKGSDLIDYYRKKAASQEEQAVRGLIEGTLTVDIAVEQIQVPVLLLAGEEDILTPPFFMKTMAIPKGEFRMVPGAHASLLERPDIFEETIVPYFRGLAYVD